MKNGIVIMLMFLLVGTNSYTQINGKVKVDKTSKVKTTTINKDIAVDIKNKIPVLGGAVIKNPKIKSIKTNGQTIVDGTTINDELEVGSEIILDASTPKKEGIYLVTKSTLTDAGNGTIIFNDENDELQVHLNGNDGSFYFLEFDIIERLGSHGNTSVKVSNTYNHSRDVTTIDLENNMKIRFLCEAGKTTYLTMIEGHFFIRSIKIIKTNINAE